MEHTEISELFEVFECAVDYLSDDENFRCFLRERTDTYARKCEQNHESIYIRFGATKLVIILDDYDWVFKIPYRTVGEKDYCQIELENYLDAQETEFGNLFSEMCYIGQYGSAPCYAMRKVEADLDLKISALESRGISYSYYDEEEEYEYTLGEEEVFEELIASLLGSEKINDFWNFCNKHRINDLHTENFGFIDDQIKLIDYSGYHGGVAR